jgi:hypothetical protein
LHWPRRRQFRAVRTQRKVDAAVVQAKALLDAPQRLQAAFAQDARHVAQKALLFGAMLGLVGHVRAEVMHLPVVGDRQVQRIQFAIDHHHAVLACLAICAPGYRGIRWR